MSIAEDGLNAILKQSLVKLCFVAGILLLIIPCIDVGKDHFKAQAPSSRLLVYFGCGLVLSSFSGAAIKFFASSRVGVGLDLSKVKKADSTFSTDVNGCTIQVKYGRIELLAFDPGTAIVLPCNEYFVDDCASDPRTALGAYVSRVFGNSGKFTDLVQEECARTLQSGSTIVQKTTDESATSYGVGRCLLLRRPLGNITPIALVSTTTQRSGEGPFGRVSYLFSAMHELFSRLADEKIMEVAMPLLGAGHGRIDRPLALVGLLIAIAEAARFQRLTKVTIVVFRKDDRSEPDVHETVIQRGLALVGSAP